MKNNLIKLPLFALAVGINPAANAGFLHLAENNAPATQTQSALIPASPAASYASFLKLADASEYGKQPESLPSAYSAARSQCWTNIANFRQGLAHGWLLSTDKTSITPISLDNAKSVIEGNGENSILPDELKYPREDEAHRRPVWTAKIKAGELMIQRINQSSCYVAATACVEPYYQHAMAVMSETDGARWAYGNDELDMLSKATDEAQAVIDHCETPKVATRPSEPVKPKYATAEISNDALFAFDSAVVSKNGHEVARLLGDEISALAEVDTVQIIGHTDRLGSNAYNYGLSTKRAAAFKKALAPYINKTIEIQTQGKGELEPSGKTDDCGDHKNAKAIACLAPDRRVVVKVFGKRLNGL